MKILFIQKQELDATGKQILEIHKKTHDVTVVNVKENKNYDQIVELIVSSDKIISW